MLKILQLLRLLSLPLSFLPPPAAGEQQQRDTRQQIMRHSNSKAEDHREQLRWQMLNIPAYTHHRHRSLIPLFWRAKTGSSSTLFFHGQRAVFGAIYMKSQCHLRVSWNELFTSAEHATYHIITAHIERISCLNNFQCTCMCGKKAGFYLYCQGPSCCYPISMPSPHVISGECYPIISGRLHGR